MKVKGFTSDPEEGNRVYHALVDVLEEADLPAVELLGILEYLIITMVSTLPHQPADEGQN